MKHSALYGAAIFGTLTLLPVKATAQDNHDDHDAGHATLETLTITSRPPGAQSLEHTAQPLSVLTGEALDRHQANTLGETLSHEPGVTGSHFGAGASRPVIRGLDGPRVRILQDGIGALDVSTISADHQVTIEPFQAEQIEIMRGPATLLYGSGASGGLVNVVTGRIPEYVPAFEAEVLGQYESANNGRTLGLKVRGGEDQFALHFDGLERDAQDYEAAIGTIENSFVESSNYNLGGSFVGSRGFVGVSVGRYDSTYGIPVEEHHGGHGHEGVFIDQEQDRINFAAQLDRPLPGLRSVSFRSSYNDYTHTEFEGPGEIGTVFQNEAWESRLEFNHVPIGPFTGSVGLQYIDRDFAAIGEEAFVPPAEQQSFGLFAFEDSDWRDWHFEIGGRLEHQDTQPANGGDISHTVYSISGGALYEFMPGYAVGLNVTRAERAPALEELLSFGPHLATGTFEIGDSSLDEETSNNLDLSLHKTTGNMSWRTNLFVNVIEDFIFLQSQDRDDDGNADFVDEAGNPGDELLLANYAQADAIFYGLEAELLYGLFDDARGSLDARLFGDWVRGKLEGGDNLPRISPARLGIALDYHRGPWQADIENIFVFEQDRTAPLETETDGYSMLNAGLSYTLNQTSAETRLFLRARNLLDEDARRHNSFLKDAAPLVGRSFLIGLNVRF